MSTFFYKPFYFVFVFVFWLHFILFEIVIILAGFIDAFSLLIIGKIDLTRGFVCLSLIFVCFFCFTWNVSSVVLLVRVVSKMKYYLIST